MSERLDFADSGAVRRWIADLRLACDDAAGVAADMLRPVRRRDLGHREHERLHQEAREKIASLLAYADPGEPEGAPPSGPRAH
jgi:hypothetical protein